MLYYPDKENASFHTFETSIGGIPLFISRQQVYLLIPVINQGIYDFKGFNEDSSNEVYVDKSYYFFTGISSMNEELWIREHGGFKGKFENHFCLNDNPNSDKEYFVELLESMSEYYSFAGSWKVKAKEFGVLVPDSSKTSFNFKEFLSSAANLKKGEQDFLFNQSQGELLEFLKTLH